MSLFTLEGRVVLVTGAGRGIGRGIAVGLAAQGAKVACAARTRSQLEETAATIAANGGEAQIVEMDMSDMESLERGVADTIRHFGHIDVLVNNAGMNIRQSIADASEANFDQIVAVNLKGLYFLSQKVARHMMERCRGKIINIGSLTTGWALPNLSVYAATKGAVGQLTKAQAVELGSFNIQVNAICPGFVITPLTEKVWADATMRTWAEDRLALGKLATPEDMVGTAAFLASSASDYVTGQSIYVDGGFMAGEDWPLAQTGVVK